MKKSTKYENSNFSALIAAESSARDIGGDSLYFSALCLDGGKKETRQGRKKKLVSPMVPAAIIH
jgi:hypothetical protein